MDWKAVRLPALPEAKWHAWGWTLSMQSGGALTAVNLYTLSTLAAHALGDACPLPSSRTAHRGQVAGGDDAPPPGVGALPL